MTVNANHPVQSTAKLDVGSLIGGGANFDGQSTLSFLASPVTKVTAAQGMSVSVWVKLATPSTGIIFQQQEGGKSIVLGIDSGKLYATVGANSTSKTADVTPGTWHHVALTAGAAVSLYLDGKEVATATGPVPDMQGEISLGKGLVGSLDELEISNVVRPAEWIKFAAQGQGPDGSMVTYGEVEAAGSEGGTSYFGTILHSVTLDGWVVIGFLMVMAVISWLVMALKSIVINKVEKANRAFLHDYRQLAIAETGQLDANDTEEDADISDSPLLTAMLGKHDHFQDSPLYSIYHTGVQEIKRRFGNIETGKQNLSPQAIGAIKASLDATLVRENQKLNSLMVLLTIAISGGPFLGLLGTVVGVMITFAAIAATGDVNVAAIAPGIAAALVATVAGLGVAIPALFGYNYIGSKIKNVTADMYVFSDEFVSRITEAYSR
jgi:biopolymer transport protein ExbB